MSQIPAIPQELIDWLDEMFPDKCPSLSDSDRQVWFKAGSRYVVDFLKSKRKEFEENRFTEEMRINVSSVNT